MAKLNRKIGKAEWKKLPESLQELYLEKDGAYFLDADDAEELTGALGKTKQELAEAKKRLDAVKDIDPENYRKLSEAAEKATRQRDLDEKNFQKILDEEAAKHAAELKKRDDLATRLVGELEAERIDGELTRAAASYKGASIDLILPAAKPQIKLKEIEGRMLAVVVDGKGQPRLKPEAKSADEFMGPADLVAEMRNDKRYAAAFPAASRQDPMLRLAPSAVGRDDRAKVDAIAAEIGAGAAKLTT